MSLGSSTERESAHLNNYYVCYGGRTWQQGATGSSETTTGVIGRHGSCHVIFIDVTMATPWRIGSHLLISTQLMQAATVQSMCKWGGLKERLLKIHDMYIFFFKCHVVCINVGLCLPSVLYCCLGFNDNDIQTSSSTDGRRCQRRSRDDIKAAAYWLVSSHNNLFTHFNICFSHPQTHELSPSLSLNHKITPPTNKQNSNSWT